MSEFPNVLRERVWHATKPHLWEQIRAAGYVLPEPTINPSERWASQHELDAYPYARSLGGISLFDFRGFNEAEHAVNYPLARWQAFVPSQLTHSYGVWLGFNPAALGDAFIAPPDLLARWLQSGELRRNIMPMIEGAHLGPLATSKILSVWIYEGGELSPTAWR